jgi:hypothetical protein
MATQNASSQIESAAVPNASVPKRGNGETRPELALADPWYANRGLLNPKFLELEGTFKDVFDALGGGEAFIKELRREPEEKQP